MLDVGRRLFGYSILDAKLLLLSKERMEHPRKMGRSPFIIWVENHSSSESIPTSRLKPASNYILCTNIDWVYDMSHVGCNIPGLYLMLEPSETPTIRFVTYQNCTCLVNNTIEYPIVDLSDQFREFNNPARMKDLMTYLVRHGIVFFFFEDAVDGYTMADLFYDE